MIGRRGTAEVQRKYRREAGRYDRRWKGYLAGTVEPTVAALRAAPFGRLLDVGCGTGVLLERVLQEGEQVDAVGADLSAEMLRTARRRLSGRAALLLGDAHRLPFRSDAFDTVVTSSVLHHWAEPERALAEVARVLRPGGRLVVTDWCADFRRLDWFSRLLRLRDRSHQRSYRLEELRRMLERAGLAPGSERRYRVGWLWGMMTVTATRPG